jgi:hypothetical protein
VFPHTIHFSNGGARGEEEPCRCDFVFEGQTVLRHGKKGGTTARHEREDDIATVAFWYQIGQPHRFTTLPPLSERILPDLDIVIEGKTMHPTAKHSPGLLELQKGYDWTGEGQLLFMPAVSRWAT